MRPGTQHTGRLLRIELAGAALVFLLLPACSGSRPSAPPVAETTGSRQAEAAWVGPRPCSTCHADLARSFARTGMGRSFYPLAGHALERFGATIHIAAQDLYYTMYEK